MYCLKNLALACVGKYRALNSTIHKRTHIFSGTLAPLSSRALFNISSISLLSRILLPRPNPSPPQTKRPNLYRTRDTCPIPTLLYPWNHCRQSPPQARGDRPPSALPGLQFSHPRQPHSRSRDADGGGEKRGGVRDGGGKRRIGRCLGSTGVPSSGTNAPGALR